MWFYYLAIFAAFFVLRGGYFYWKLRSVVSLKKRYYEYIGGKQEYEFLQYKPQIISLFKEAGVKNFSFTHIEQISYSSGLRYDLDGFDNLNSIRSDVVSNIKSKFEETIGIFRHNMLQSFNPLYWVEFIVKFPAKLISFLDLSPPKSVISIVQLLFWTAGLLTFLDKFNLIDISSWFSSK